MTDADFRNAALFAVQRLWRRFGDAVPFQAIDQGLLHQDHRIPFLSAWEGAYKPRQLDENSWCGSTLWSNYEDERISDDHLRK